MSTAEWVRLAVVFAGLCIGGSGLVSVLLFRAQSAKVKAETVKINAETDAIRVDDQSQIIKDLREELGRLQKQVTDQGVRIEKLEARNDDLERSNRSLRGALLAVTQWVQRVWSMLTPEQRKVAGPPPDTDHLINA